jgi:tetratricopeptide (TPR) repeat protein
VFGRQVEFSLLQNLTQRPPDELLSLVETAIAAQLLVETASEQLAFRHALTRQAVYASLLAPRRRTLHLHIAQTLERQGARAIEDSLADLAFHFYQAEAWLQALEYGRRSGEKALALYSPQAAVEHFTHALEAAAHLPDAGLAHLYRLRGQAYELLGNFEAAQSDFEKALSAARALEDRETEWQILMVLAFLWTERDYPRADDYLQRALELAQALADTQKYAFVQNLRGYWLTNAGQPEAAIKLHEEALAISQERSEVQSVGSTLQYLALALMYNGDLQRADNCNDRAIAFARAWDDKRSLVNCLTQRITLASPFLHETTFSVREPLAKRLQDMQELLALADSIEWRMGQALAYYTASIACSSSGLLGQALAYAHVGLACATEIEDVQWMAACYYALGLAYLLLLDPLEALPTLEKALALARQRRSVFWIRLIPAMLARLHLLRGDLPAAEAMLTQAFSPDQTPSNLQERFLLLVWGELALARHHPDQALRLADILIVSAPGKSQDSPIAALWKLRGEALYALGRVEEALGVLEAAAAEAQRQGALPLLWQIQRSLGRAYLTTRRRRPAREVLAAAHETITSIAASLDDEQGTRFLQAALATLPKQLPLTPLQAAKAASGGLSAREREIALLIAQGKTNREIAAALNISRSTTATHISHIYNQLGISSRAQLAAWVVDQGIAQLHHTETPDG